MYDDPPQVSPIVIGCLIGGVSGFLFGAGLIGLIWWVT